jgi:tetratricopeptide (TPR) repeat protein
MATPFDKAPGRPKLTRMAVSNVSVRDRGLRLPGAVVLLVLAVPVALQPAQAQQQQRSPGRPNPAPTAPVRPQTIDDLFERLAKAKSEDEAKGIAGAIERRWMRSGSDTADLLMTRAMDALKAGDQPLSVELLDRVIALQPAWAEAWNKRATVFYLMGDYTRSIADIREVLALEPRHFGALAGLGMIFKNNGDDKRAYEALKKALAVHPYMSDLRNIVERMAPDVEGRDI